MRSTLSLIRNFVVAPSFLPSHAATPTQSAMTLRISLRGASQTLLGLGVVLLLHSPARAWEVVVDTGPSDNAYALGVDAADNVFAAGSLRHPIVNSGAFAVMKLSRADGSQQWRRVFDDDTGESARAVSVDAAGDVVAAGGGLDGFIVSKLASADGARLWLKQIHGSPPGPLDSATAVTVDGSGNVVAAGRLQVAPSQEQLTVVKLQGSDGGELWRAQISGLYTAEMVGVDAAGDVVAVGQGGIVKLSGSTGAELWRSPSSISIWYHGLAFDPLGNVVVAGGSPFLVMKLSGTTGAEIWRSDLYGDFPKDGCEIAYGVTIDSVGDIVAGGRVCNTATPFGGLTVIKLDGSNGNELWRRVMGDGYFYELALDSVDNVAAAGSLADCDASGCSSAKLIVAKVQGADGVELWRNTIGAGSDAIARAVVVDAADDVAAAGFMSNSAGTDLDFTVLKVFGTNGEDSGPLCGNGVLETGEACDDANLVDGDGCSGLCAETATPESVTAPATPGIPVTTDTESDGATAADPVETSVTSPSNSGTVSIDEEPLSGGFAQYQMLGQQVHVTAPAASLDDPLVLVFRLDASRVPEGENETTISVFKNGLPVSACSGLPNTASPDPCVSNRATLFDGDIEITVLSATASYWNLGVRVPAQRVAGTALLIAGNSTDASKSKIVLKLVDSNLVMAAPGSGNDPTCAGGGGARMEVFNTAGSGERAGFDLPCEHWSVLGSAGKEKGYKYTDKEGASGPVTVALIKNRKSIKMVAKGSQIAYTLDEASQGSMGVAFRTGASTGYCAEFGATTITKDEPERFAAKGALAPPVCP